MQTLYSNSDTLQQYEHADWLKAIEFYKDDLVVLQKRLAELGLKTTRQSVLAGIEHFQNQFIVQKNNLDELHHYVHEHILHVQNKFHSSAGSKELELTGEHEKRKAEFESLEKVMSELRKEFNRFLAKWL